MEGAVSLLTTTDLHCACGRVHLQVDGAPFVSVACCCTSCQTAGDRFLALPGAPQFKLPDGTTQYLFYRKDRIRFVAGQEFLRDYKLKDTSKTRRVVASCCNTPIFLEALGGHWLSVYAALLPKDAVPPLELRTMSVDMPGVTFNDSVPTPKTHVPWFFWRIFKAWAQMGFRRPKVQVAGKLEM